MWLPQYSMAKLQSDCIAGITVGLMVIPQGLAYANIAALPPQYGLYSCLMCGLVYAIFGSCKDINQGPTAIMALMVARYGSTADPVNFAVALSFFSGIILLLMGTFSLGFIVQIMPLPVISGFTSSAAISIACGQISNILGLKGIPKDFVQGLLKIALRIEESQYKDLVLSIVCYLLLSFLRYVHTLTILWPVDEMKPMTTLKNASRNLVWLVCTARNAVVVFASAIICFVLNEKDMKPFTLIGEVQDGLPHAKVSEKNFSTTLLILTYSPRKCV